MMMSDEINEDKLREMWNKILRYEQNNTDAGTTKATKDIVEIIKEVYNKCY